MSAPFAGIAAKAPPHADCRMRESLRSAYSGMPDTRVARFRGIFCRKRLGGAVVFELGRVSLIVADPNPNQLELPTAAETEEPLRQEAPVRRAQVQRQQSHPEIRR